MKNWQRNVLKIFPIESIVNYLLDMLAAEAAKTETEIDDKAVEVVRMIINTALGNK